MKKRHKKDSNLAFNDMLDPVKVELDEFCKVHDLEIIHDGGLKEIEFRTFNINRPGLMLTGFTQHFVPQRVQVLGEMENSYIMSLGERVREISLDRLCRYGFPCLIHAHGIRPCKQLESSAQKYNRVLLFSKSSTIHLIKELTYYLSEMLAESMTVHGVLIDLYGVGVLLIGRSGVGKSETALELVQRNHRLVADDAVIIKLVNDIIVGESPAITKHFMEVRGIGIIDIRNIYGTGAVRSTKAIDLVVELEDWDSNKEYDRLGNEILAYQVLGKSIPKILLPVKPGRNIAVLLEVAARNYRLKAMGHDTLKQLQDRMNGKFD